MKWVLSALVASVVLAVCIAIIFWPRPVIPKKLSDQLTSTLLLPNDKRFPIDEVTPKYDTSLKLLSFNINAFGTTIATSEQQAPDSFADVPDVYTKVLDSMNDYEDFDTGIGTIHLTKPLDLNGKQTAVLSAKGTLLFAKPATNLSADQWRTLFNTFITQAP